MPTLNLRGRFVNSLLPQERLGELAHDRRGVEQLVRRQAGGGTADDVADVVHAGLQRHQADRLEPLPDLRDVADLEPAQLNLLPRRDVDEAGAELAADRRDRADLGGVGVRRSTSGRAS